MLARREGGARHVEVQMIWRADVDHVDGRVIQQPTPVGAADVELEFPGRGSRPLLVDVGHCHAAWRLDVGEYAPDAAERDGVGPPHESGADQPEAETGHGASPIARRRSGQPALRGPAGA